jgi:Ca2+-transporting ATPase
LFVAPLTNFFEFESLSLQQLLTCIAIGLISVIWFEVVKWIKGTNKNVG